MLFVAWSWRNKVKLCYVINDMSSIDTPQEPPEEPVFETDIDWVAEIEEADAQAEHDAREREYYMETELHAQRLWNER
jgi:hypothetical protein